MKILKNFFSFLIILLFVLSNPSFSGKRNLSTPLSRLVGHWINSSFGMHYYFGPITDKSNMIGSMVVIFPDKNMIIKYFEKIREQAAPQTEDLKDYIEKFVGDYNVIMALAGKARYSHYKLISQKQFGMEIDIKVIDYPKIFGFFGIPPELSLYIDKNGKKIKLNFLPEEVLKDLLEKHTEIMKFLYADWVYVNSKTSPDDIE